MKLLGLLLATVLCVSAGPLNGKATNDSEKNGTPLRVDLSSVMRLANANNLDIQIAREKIKEAKATHLSSISQFLPWLAPGITYRRHDNQMQAVNGEFLEVHKQAYSPGITLAAQVETGDALYKSLATRQQVRATEHALEAQRQQTVLTAVQDYFGLLLAQANVGATREAVRISGDQLEQVRQAVAAGLIFKGDELRARTQSERNRLSLQQAEEKKRIASAKLLQTLHLDPTIELEAIDSELAPLDLTEQNSTLSFLVEQGLARRPERKQWAATIQSARAAKSGAVYGPLIPTLGAQVFAGGLGGDSSAGPSSFREQEDYFVGLSWRIGPGGLFDVGRTRAAEARLRTAELSAEKLKDTISGEVVQAFVRVNSLREQILRAKEVLATAEEGLKLAQLRKEFAVGVVLENIQAEQDLTRARFDYLQAVASFNIAQFDLQRALGGLENQPSPKRASMQQAK